MTDRKVEGEESIPVDPLLSVDFFSTANERRSVTDLATWWDRPFIQTTENGQFHVLCLDGGSWDRPTFYGIADTIAAAKEMAKEKLTAWRALRARPTLHMVDVNDIQVVRMPQHPHRGIEVLKSFDSVQKAAQFIAQVDPGAVDSMPSST